MISIGKFAELAKVSARTVRYYDSIGLLPASSRGENNYRYYSENWLARMIRIRDLQDLGFSLEEIKRIIDFSESNISNHLIKRLEIIEQEIGELEEKKLRILELLSVSKKIQIGESLTPTERNLYMESIQEEINQGLYQRYKDVTEATQTYLQRDGWLQKQSEFSQFAEAIKKCFEFAQQKKLKLGFARGCAPASLAMYSLGFSVIDPMKYTMIPERLSSQTLYFHIDVEYKRGQEFVDFCKEINRTLPHGEIQAFKMPLLDIVQGVHAHLGTEIDYDSIDDNSDIVLNPFRNLDIKNIFQFDFSENALVMQYEYFLPEYSGLDKMIIYLHGQKTLNFRDIINITALWRPHCQQMADRIQLYKKAEHEHHSYGILSDKIETWLKPNHGTILYHEDLIQIISEYSGWNFSKSNALRRALISTKKNDELKD